jgi:hypothetical protein
MDQEQREFLKPLPDILEEHGIHFRENSTNQLIIEKCFNCNRFKKLYVNAETGSFMCFRCEVKGGPTFLLANLIGCSYKEANVYLYGKTGPVSIYAEDGVEDPLRLTGTLKGKRTDATMPLPITLPADMKPLTKDDVEAWEYLTKKRGLTDEVINALNLYHWKSAKRVVFLVTKNGEIFGTLARDYIGDQVKKVLNSVGGWRSFNVWNFDNAKSSKELVICEGAFSAIKCGYARSIALLGKAATAGQIELIRTMDAKKIYICLDVGTEIEQYKLFTQLSLYYHGQIYKINLPPIKLFKCSCGIKSEYLYDSEDNTDTEWTCSCGKLYKEKDFFQLLKDSEFKDSGDYDFEQMDAFIRNAKKFKGGPSSWL